MKDYSDKIIKTIKEIKEADYILIGAGFNTPAIIRWPFDRIAVKHPNATLIRMNIDYPELPEKIVSKSLSFSEDIKLVLANINSTGFKNLESSLR